MTLKELRQNKGLTQTEVAQLIGKSNRIISHYETGRVIPPLEVAVKLAKVLGVSVEEIYEALPKKKGAEK